MAASEAKVGLLVVAALGGLAWVSTQSGIISSGRTEPMRDLASTFSDVAGITVGTPVRMAGVDVGDVTDISLQPNGTAVVKYRVKKSAPIPADVTADITTNGLIGEKYLALVPGMSSLSSGTTPMLLPPPATPGEMARIPASGAGAGGDMMGKFGQVGDDLQAMTGTLRKVLGDPETADKLQRIIDGLAEFSDKLNSDQSALGAVMSKDGGQTKQTLNDVNAAMKDLKEIMAKVNNGEGTIGKLINDPSTADKIDNALETLSGVGERVEQFRTEVDFHAYSLPAESGVGKGVFTLTLQPRPTRYYVLGATADGFASLAKDTDRLNGGAYFGKDFGNKTKLTAQFGHVFQNVAGTGQDLGVRVGLKDSSGGIGFDTAIPTPFDAVGDIALSVDAYDFGGNNIPDSNTTHVDAKAKINLWQKMVYGVIGYDNILDQEYGSPIIGLGLRFQDDDLKYLIGRSL